MFVFEGLVVWHGNYRDCRKVVQGSRYRFQCQDFCRVVVQPSQTPLHPLSTGVLGAGMSEEEAQTV